VAGSAGNSLYSFPSTDAYEASPETISPIGSWVNSPGKTKVPETVT
jgi:hypothetical protein